MQARLDGRNAIITGGSAGIGKAIAATLARSLRYLPISAVMMNALALSTTLLLNSVRLMFW